MGGIVHFVEYLRETGFLDRLLRGSPLACTSPNAPAPADVMGTLLVAVLDGLTRYAHINFFRRDAVCPETLGIARRPVRRKPDGAPDAPAPDDASRQLLLPSSEEWGLDGPADQHRDWDFCVLVTDMPGFDAVALSQIYRDRGDVENVFDELKAQWGWSGFTTRDLARNRVVARRVAVVYNLWSLYVRLGSPEAHREAKTSRPVLLRILGRLVHSGRQTTLHLVSGHARADRIEAFLTGIHKFFEALKANVEQLGPRGVWKRILAVALRHCLHPSGDSSSPGLPGQQTFAFA